MYSLFVKEIKSFLGSLVGLYCNGCFPYFNRTVFVGVSFFDNILQRGFADINGLFQIAPLVFLLLIPAITMLPLPKKKKQEPLNCCLRTH
jgi:ABC-2 type transport system permease protein